MALKLFSRKTPKNAAPSRRDKVQPRRPIFAQEGFEPAAQTKLAEDTLERLLQLERYGVVTVDPRPWGGQPNFEAVYMKAIQAIDRDYALVPEGFVSLPQTISDEPGAPEVDVETEPFLIARHCVTNLQYQKFVDSGAYGELEFWPKDIWPCLVGFRDLTDQAAPRFWRNARHDRRFSDHPVVGISYYEALAYARWAGCRLPTEAEWQMAASWRIRSAAHILRRFPWGDALDKNRCNIWMSGVGHTLPVNACESGAAPNGALQLIGNVWEWTSSDFEIVDGDGNPIVGDTLLKSIRGGAFDTYFPAQATSLFRTGLASLIRAHNVGFRLALDSSVLES